MAKIDLDDLVDGEEEVCPMEELKRKVEDWWKYKDTFTEEQITKYKPSDKELSLYFLCLDCRKGNKPLYANKEYFDIFSQLTDDVLSSIRDGYVQDFCRGLLSIPFFTPLNLKETWKLDWEFFPELKEILTNCDTNIRQPRTEAAITWFKKRNKPTDGYFQDVFGFWAQDEDDWKLINEDIDTFVTAFDMFFKKYQKYFKMTN